MLTVARGWDPLVCSHAHGAQTAIQMGQACAAFCDNCVTGRMYIISDLPSWPDYFRRRFSYQLSAMRKPRFELDVRSLAPISAPLPFNARELGLAERKVREMQIEAGDKVVPLVNLRLGPHARQRTDIRRRARLPHKVLEVVGVERGELVLGVVLEHGAADVGVVDDRADGIELERGVEVAQLLGDVVPQDLAEGLGTLPLVQELEEAADAQPVREGEVLDGVQEAFEGQVDDQVEEEVEDGRRLDLGVRQRHRVFDGPGGWRLEVLGVAEELAED